MDFYLVQCHKCQATSSLSVLFNQSVFGSGCRLWVSSGEVTELSGNSKKRFSQQTRTHADTAEKLVTHRKLEIETGFKLRWHLTKCGHCCANSIVDSIVLNMLTTALHIKYTLPLFNFITVQNENQISDFWSSVHQLWIDFENLLCNIWYW